jgi:hypothetical protein
MDSIAYRFPISTGTDLKVTHTDGTVAAGIPYTRIKTRYFNRSFSRQVDGSQYRYFGIVVDTGTHSGCDGTMTSSGNTMSTLIGGIVGADYTGGTLTVHNGGNKGTYAISGTPSGTVVTITTTFPVTKGQLSFTLQRAVPVVATAEQIYEKVQYLLRQSSDIDDGFGSIIGKTADELVAFVGSDLKCGIAAPTNPHGGGSGVIIEGFKAADTNRIAFYDNGASARAYPYVASLTISFGDNLKNDANAKYWIYFTTLPGANNDYGEVNAVIVDDNTGTDMAGNVSGVASVDKSFNYDGNVQGGRTQGTDATITAVAIGLSTGQYVKATGTIAKSTSNSITLTAPFERNYSNP